MRSLKTNKVFVSAYKANLDDETNYNNHTKAMAMLRSEGLSYRIVLGSYKGFDEQTLMLESTDINQHSENLTVAKNISLLFNQDSVLEVENDNSASLHYKDGVGRIGTFTEVSADEVNQLSGYTYDPETKRYFTIK